MEAGSLLKEAGITSAKALRQRASLVLRSRAVRQGRQLHAFTQGPCTQKGLRLGS